MSTTRQTIKMFAFLVLTSTLCGPRYGCCADTGTLDTRRFALLIGINNYPRLPESKQLRGCVNDVQLMRQTLLEYAGFAETDVIAITNEQATRAGILQALEKLTERVGQANSQGKTASVLLHFSGHGSQVLDQLSGPDRDERGYLDQTLVPHDADAEGGGQDIRDDELNAWARRLTNGNGNRLLIILDCCHSGTGMRGSEGRKRQLDRSFELPQLDSFGDPSPTPLPKNVAVISACLATETEDECVIAGEDYGLLSAHLCKLARELQPHGELRLRDLPELLRWQYLTRSTPSVPPHPQVELATSAEGIPLFFASSPTDSDQRLGLMQIDDFGTGVLNRGAIDGVSNESKLRIVSRVESDSNFINLDLYRALVTETGPTKSRTRIVLQDGSLSNASSEFPAGKYLVHQEQRHAIPSIGVFVAMEDATQKNDWRNALSDPVIRLVDSEESADRILRIEPNRVCIQLVSTVANGQDSLLSKTTDPASSSLMVSDTIVLERLNAREETTLAAWQTKVTQRLRELAVDRFLTNLVAEHASEMQRNNPEESKPTIELVASKTMPPTGQFPELVPCELADTGIAILETGDLYALKVVHPWASQQAIYATIVHIDPLGEISIMCPREFSQTETELQRIDAEKGLITSIFRCNGDAMLDRSDPEFAPPVKGVHKAIVLFGSEPLDLSSLGDFLRSDRSSADDSKTNVIEVKFESGRTRSREEGAICLMRLR